MRLHEIARSYRARRRLEDSKPFNRIGRNEGRGLCDPDRCDNNPSDHTWRLNDVIPENNELIGKTVVVELSEAIEEFAEGLTVSQTEKLISLSEDVDFDGDIDSFKKKIEIIKETYFGANGKVSEKEEDDFERSDNELNEEAPLISDPVLRRYAAKIKQTIKEDLLVK